MFSILGILLSILSLSFSWLSPSPPTTPSTQAPAPADKELTVTHWEETYAPLPDSPAPADQPTPQAQAAPLSDPDLTLGRAPSAPSQVTP